MARALGTPTFCLRVLVPSLATAALVGCFATIDRSKIDDGNATLASDASGDTSSDALASGPQDATASSDARVHPEAAATSPCSARHDFCADFDGLGSTGLGTSPTDFGFEPLLAAERGTGSVAIEGGGVSPPHCAHVTTPADPVNKPGESAGVRLSLDPSRGLELSFDVMIAKPDWKGYDASMAFKFATVATARDTLTLALFITNPAAFGVPDQFAIQFDDASAQPLNANAAIRYGMWMHIDIVIASAGVSVKVDGTTGLTHGAVPFDAPGSGLSAFVLGSIRDFDSAPATDVRIDNVVLDYR